MTVVTVATFRNLMGLSTDAKPSVEAGSRFLETDTMTAYIYTGAAWVVLVPARF